MTTTQIKGNATAKQIGYALSLLGELTTATAVLEAIPAHLDAYGWCQGADHNGEGAACLWGAINDLTSPGPVRSEVSLRIQVTVGASVVRWNDRNGRTVEEVKDACLKAAAADLRYVNLRGAYLRSADLRGAN